MLAFCTLNKGLLAKISMNAHSRSFGKSTRIASSSLFSVFPDPVNPSSSFKSMHHTLS